MVVLARINDLRNNLSRSNNLCIVKLHESCQKSIKSMNHCGLTPRPPLQINRKIRKGSKLTKLKQNHTNPLVKASETMKTPDKNILEITKALKLFF